MAQASTAPPTQRRPNETHRRGLHQAQRRFVLLAAALVGVIAGALAVIFQSLVKLAEGASHRIAELETYGPFLLVFVGISSGAFAGWITGRFAPEAGGSGIPHVKAVLMNLRVLRPMVLIPVKMIGGLSALVAGMSLGREGPTIQMGAAAGQVVAKVFKAPRRSYATLIASGAGAGLAAAFNAPLAGFLFVMEELKREMSTLTYGAALISSVCAVAVSRLELGQETSFNLSNPSPIALRALPLVILVGLFAALIGVAFNKLTIKLISVREKLNVSRWLAGGIVGGIAAICLLLLPDVSGGGHHVAESILAGHFDRSLGFLILVLAVKLALTSSSFATGVPGGIFAPILVLGALTGYILGILFANWFPSLGISPNIFATVGMAAMLSASVRAPLTGVVLIVEMTQQYSLLYALLCGAFVSYIVADLIRDTPIYEALLERDLHRSGELGKAPESAVPLDLMVEPDSYMDGRTIKTLNLPPGALIITIERNGAYIVPHGSTKLRYGDHITVLLGGEHSDAASLALHDAAQGP